MEDRLAIVTVNSCCQTLDQEKVCSVLKTMIIYRMANLNLLSHPNATLAPQARQARASSENLNYMTLAPKARQVKPSGDILNYLLSRYSDILE